MNHIKFKQVSLSILLKQIHSDSFSSQPYVSRISNSYFYQKEIQFCQNNIKF